MVKVLNHALTKHKLSIMREFGVFGDRNITCGCGGTGRRARLRI